MLKCRSDKFIITAALGLAAWCGGPALVLAYWGQGPGTGPGPWMMGGWGVGWFGSIFMTAFWILILIGLFFLVKWLIKATRGEDKAPAAGPSALTILQERYARGEIDRQEYEEKKRVLMG